MNRIQRCERKIRGRLCTGQDTIFLQGTSNILLACSDSRINSTVYAIWEETKCHTLLSVDAKQYSKVSFRSNIIQKIEEFPIGMLIVLTALDNDVDRLIDLSTIGMDLSLHSIIVPFQVLWQILEIELQSVVEESSRLITKDETATPNLLYDLYDFTKVCTVGVKLNCESMTFNPYKMKISDALNTSIKYLHQLPSVYFKPI